MLSYLLALHRYVASDFTLDFLFFGIFSLCLFCMANEPLSFRETMHDMTDVIGVDTSYCMYLF